MASCEGETHRLREEDDCIQQTCATGHSSSSGHHDSEAQNGEDSIDQRKEHHILGEEDISALKRDHRPARWEDRKVRQQARRTLENYVRSILADGEYVECIRKEYDEFPLIANKRNGVWYHPNFDDTCYFKSTDGHHGNWNFSPVRLNFNVLEAALANEGVIIVDSTRRGKKFPDALSKTVPIWCAVLNSVVYQSAYGIDVDPCQFLHLPPWVSPTEQDSIKAKMPGWVNHLQRNKALVTNICGKWDTDYAFRPLRCVWICRDDRREYSHGVEYSHIATCPFCCNEILPDYVDSPECQFLNGRGPCTCDLQRCMDDLPVLFGGFLELGFIPVICLSSSMEWKEEWQRESMSWTYIQGAGDDEEAWVPMVQPAVSEKLTPQLLWENPEALLGDTNTKLVTYVCFPLLRNWDKSSYCSPFPLCSKPSSVERNLSRGLLAGADAFQSVVRDDLLVGSVNDVALQDAKFFEERNTEEHLRYYIIDLGTSLKECPRERLTPPGPELQSTGMTQKTSERFLYTYVPISKRKNSYSREYWTRTVLPAVMDVAFTWITKGPVGSKLVLLDNQGDYAAPVAVVAVLLAFVETTGAFKSWICRRNYEPVRHYSKEDIQQMVMLVQVHKHQHTISRRLVKELNNFFVRSGSQWEYWLSRKGYTCHP
eukprot:gb/GECG01008859.1/.p1 GENE.gb/GECG01008859.1/~~gb/GECG01008859.1/.p1  ORF type:complete len:655 (+),score=59.75 gb/GECG01008859.1/:1-1965(+)